MAVSYSAYAAREIVGLYQRRLDYWDERGIVRPSIKKGAGKGSARRYSFNDLIKLTVVKQLRDAGVSLQAIRKALRLLTKRSLSTDPLATETLVTDGKRLHRLTRHPGIIEDILAGGQLVFSVVALGQIRQEVRQKVVRLEEKIRLHRRGRPRAIERKRHG